MTRDDYIKSMVLFLLEDVEEDTKESAVDIYRRWKEKTGIVVKGPKLAAWTLEFFNSQKNFRRDAIREAAVIDGYIPR